MDHNHFKETIVAEGWIKRGSFILASGRKSDYYIDLRPCVMSPRFVYLPITALLSHLRGNLSRSDAFCGVMASGLPLVGALIYRLSTCEHDICSCYCRIHSSRTHGLKQQVEGPVDPLVHQITIIDDVSTSGRSLVSTVEVLRSSGFTVKEAVVLVDREEGASAALAAMGVPFYPLIRVSELTL